MPPRKRAAAAGIQPPQLPAELPALGAPATLVDEAELRAGTLSDADWIATRAEDLLFEEVILRRVRLAQAELTRPQISDAQLDTCDRPGPA